MNVKVQKKALLWGNKLNQIQQLLNIFLINMTTWEDSPDMLLIAATIKWTNTVSAYSGGPNSLKIWAFKVAESGTRISTMSSQQSNV